MDSIEPEKKKNPVEDLFRRDFYEIISPYKANSRIFNKKDFNIEITQEEGKKIVIIREK